VVLKSVCHKNFQVLQHALFGRYKAFPATSTHPYTHSHTLTRMHTHAHNPPPNTDTQACTRMCTYTYRQTPTNAYMHTPLQVRITSLESSLATRDRELATVCSTEVGGRSLSEESVAAAGQRAMRAEEVTRRAEVEAAQCKARAVHLEHALRSRLVTTAVSQSCKCPDFIWLCA